MSKFINPYAFVGLPDKKTIEKRQNEETFTGKIECSLHPRTPLFIPNTTYDKVFRESKEGNAPEKKDESGYHKSYDFYSYEDISEQSGSNSLNKPVIPGSSLRGEVRSLYEALTGSCLSTVDSKLVLYKRMPDPGKMGLLKNVGGKFELYKAEKYMACYEFCSSDNSNKKFNGSPTPGRTYFDTSKFTEGMHVWIKSSGFKYKNKPFLPETVDEISTTSKSGFQEGYILIGEPFSKRHHFSIACVSTKAMPIGKNGVSKREIEMFEQVLDLYKDPRINKSTKHIQNEKYSYEKYKEQYEKIKQSGRCIPVFFKTEDTSPGSTTMKYISPACISKEVYQNTIPKLLEESDLDPCTDIKKLCPACILFGMVEKGKDNGNLTALSGRVRFSDATLKQEEGISLNLKNIYHDKVTLKELSSPKISSTEFYLRPPNTTKSKDHGADMWNYDFSFKWNGDRRGTLITSYKPRVNGRKFYWQHKPFSLNNITTMNQSIRNSTIHPIKPCKKEAGNGNPDYSFVFEVYFERLTKVELNRLIAVLQLRLDENKTGYHSIGHGKPFGMGSVKIMIDNILVRKLSIDNESIHRSLIEYDEMEHCQTQSLVQTFGDKKYVRQVMTICDVHDFKYPIIYPVPEDGRESYNWFVYNRRSNNKPIIDQILPEVPSNGSSLNTNELAEIIALLKNTKKQNSN